MKKYLIIGNGTAGTTAAEQIQKHDPTGSITLITREALPLYSRLRLPEFLGGTLNKNQLIIKSLEWHQSRRINLLTETTITDIDYSNHQATSMTGAIYEYDTLLLASGSLPFVPPIKGIENGHVMTLRHVQDVKTIQRRIQGLKNVIAIGGGLLGLEAASALINFGCKVTVVEFFDRLLPRQLDHEGAARLQKLLEDKGLHFKLGVSTEEITNNGIILNSGETVSGELILVSAGVRPDLSLVKGSGIDTQQGIVVNHRMETSLPSVYAAGDVAEYEGVNYCIWPEAMEQGRVAGINMTGGDAVFKQIPPANRLKVVGIDLASVGEIDVDNKLTSDIVSTDATYRKNIKDSNGNMVGSIMLGDTADFNKIVKQIKGE